MCARRRRGDASLLDHRHKHPQRFHVEAHRTICCSAHQRVSMIEFCTVSRIRLSGTHHFWRCLRWTLRSSQNRPESSILEAKQKRRTRTAKQKRRSHIAFRDSNGLPADPLSVSHTPPQEIPGVNTKLSAGTPFSKGLCFASQFRQWNNQRTPVVWTRDFLIQQWTAYMNETLLFSPSTSARSSSTTASWSARCASTARSRARQARGIARISATCRWAARAWCCSKRPPSKQPDGSRRIVSVCIPMRTNMRSPACSTRCASSSDMPIGIQLCHAGRKASSEPPWRGGSWSRRNRVDGARLDRRQSRRVTTRPASGTRPRRHEPYSATRSGQRAAPRVLGLAAIELHFCARLSAAPVPLACLQRRSVMNMAARSWTACAFRLEIYDAVRNVWPADEACTRRARVPRPTESKAAGMSKRRSSLLSAALQRAAATGSMYRRAASRRSRKFPSGRCDRSCSRVPCAKQPVSGPSPWASSPRQTKRTAWSWSDANLIAIARAVQWTRCWPWHAAAELGATIKAPPQYWRCEPRSTKRVFDGASFGQR